MLPERDQHHITLEEIISNAKEIMLREGKRVPVLIVEGGTSLIAGQIPDMPPTHGESVEEAKDALKGYKTKHRPNQSNIPTPPSI